MNKEYYHYSEEEIEFILCEHFLHITCSGCSKTYDKSWARDREQGIPVYYQWEGHRPLMSEEMIAALNGKLKVNWFCSAKCSGSGVNPLLTAQNEKQPTASSVLPASDPSQDLASILKQSSLSQIPEIPALAKKKHR